MSRRRANPGAPAAEQGSGPWRRRAEGSSCCIGGDGSPAHFGQAMRRCQLRCRNPGVGRSWLPATSAKPAKKCREEAGGQTPAENVTERRPASRSGLGKADPRHPSSFSHTVGWSWYMRAPIDGTTLTLTCVRQTFHGFEPAVAPLLARTTHAYHLSLSECSPNPRRSSRNPARPVGELEGVSMWWD